MLRIMATNSRFSANSIARMPACLRSKASLEVLQVSSSLLYVKVSCYRMYHLFISCPSSSLSRLFFHLT